MLPSLSASHLDSEISTAWVLGWTLHQDDPETALRPLAIKVKERGGSSYLLTYHSANPCDRPPFRLFPEYPEVQIVVTDPSIGWVVAPACCPKFPRPCKGGLSAHASPVTPTRWHQDVEKLGGEDRQMDRKRNWCRRNL